LIIGCSVKDHPADSNLSLPGPEMATPVESLVGTIAFGDKSGMLSLTLADGGAMNTLVVSSETEIRGSILYERVVLPVKGTIDYRGHLEATALGVISGQTITFIISGDYDVVTGEFFGTITRIINGGVPESGIVASVITNNTIVVDIYLGKFANDKTGTGFLELGTWNLVVKSGEVTGTFWHRLDDYGGVIEGTAHNGSIALSVEGGFVDHGTGEGFIVGTEVNGTYTVSDSLGHQAGGGWSGTKQRGFIIVPELEKVWDGDCIIDSVDDLAYFSQSGYSRITGDLIIYHSNTENLKGLENLITVDGSLFIQYSEELKSLSGLESLTSIGRDLIVSYNHELSNFQGLDALSGVGKSLLVEGNQILESFKGLDSLTSIGVDLKILDNEKLEDVSALGGLTYLGGGLVIEGNTSLEDLTGLERFLSDSAGELVFKDQPKGIVSTGTYSLRNTGSDEFVIYSVSLSGDDADEYEVAEAPDSIPPGMDKNIVISFQPVSVGLKEAKISIANSTGTDIVIDVSGKATRYALYLLMGQSNMVGRDVISTVPDRQSHPRVYQMDRSRNWVLAVDPLAHNDTGTIGVGPGLTFAKTIADDVSQQVEIGLIPTARGGTSITEWERGDMLYDDAVARALTAVNSGIGTIMGVLWHQGERNSKTLSDAHAHEGRLKILVESLREDLGNPDLPFICGNIYMGLPQSKYPYATIVNATLTDLPNQVPNTDCVSSEGLTHKGDYVHFNSASQREFGKRYANAAKTFLE
jgi:hypothetical protein